MNDNTITKLLAGMQKPARLYKQTTLRLTTKQFIELESYCKVRYLNYSDVMRKALEQYLKSN